MKVSYRTLADSAASTFFLSLRSAHNNRVSHHAAVRCACMHQVPSPCIHAILHCTLLHHLPVWRSRSLSHMPHTPDAMCCKANKVSTKERTFCCVLLKSRSTTRNETISLVSGHVKRSPRRIPHPHTIEIAERATFVPLNYSKPSPGWSNGTHARGACLTDLSAHTHGAQHTRKGLLLVLCSERSD